MTTQSEQTLSDAIIGVRGKLEKRLSDISKIVEINDLIFLVVEKNLNAVSDDLKKIGKGGGTMKIIDHSLKLLESTTSNPTVIEQKAIIREQLMVLLIGSLETYLSDTIRTIGNTQPNFFRFKEANEKISFSHAILQEGFTLGDAILEHIDNKKYSFQDLKSTLDVFANYLDIQLDVADYKDRLILMAASRHIIVHNNSIVDRRFLNQIRDTVYKNAYRSGNIIKIDEVDIDEAKQALGAFADEVVSGVINRDES